MWNPKFGLELIEPLIADMIPPNDPFGVVLVMIFEIGRYTLVEWAIRSIKSRVP